MVVKIPKTSLDVLKNGFVVLELVSSNPSQYIYLDETKDSNRFEIGYEGRDYYVGEKEDTTLDEIMSWTPDEDSVAYGDTENHELYLFTLSKGSQVFYLVLMGWQVTYERLVDWGQINIVRVQKLV